MGKSYSHLSLIEREKLYALKTAGYSLRDISKELRRSHSSLSRELQRNAPYFQEYLPCRAQKKAQNRAEKQRYQAPLKCPLVYLYVRKKLKIGWSPEAIAGRLPVDHAGYSIDDDTIYRYIYHPRRKRERLFEYLTLHRKQRMRKNGRKIKSVGKIVGAVSIDKRPKTVGQRVSFGHWETDNMEGVRSDRVGVSATVERLTRFTALSKLNDKKASSKTAVVVSRLQELPSFTRKTVTTDNGAENSKHTDITKQTGVRVYFAHPYHSWEKGTVENTIGRLRRYLPKKQSLQNLTEQELQIIEYYMNSTPRKCLGYLTPYEAFKKHVKSFVYFKNSGGALPLRM